jgi:ribonuclease R
MGRVLQKDLAHLDFALRFPPHLQVDDAAFVEGEPLGGRSPVLNVTRVIPEKEAFTWAAIFNHALPYEFPAEALAEAKSLKPYTWAKPDAREDLRELAFVTIDGADAKDFDDAVWAEPDPNGEEGAFHIIVAIADVAHYVTPGSPLDVHAEERGNSTYLSGRVLPMLPEELSNNLCSLKPDEDRPVLAVHLHINAAGKLTDYRFTRATIHSHARLVYEDVQTAFDSAKPTPNMPKSVWASLQALRMAARALTQAKTDRGAMDLDLPETMLKFAPDGTVETVALRPRLESHRLIEELMILANVAAATFLSRKGGGLYRIHGEPTKEKLLNLKITLSPLGFTVPAPNAGPKAWAKLVTQINGHPAAQTLLRSVLQSQQQAKYDATNIGHYGLALTLYTHFTSPIRRYADLVVHRALLSAMGQAETGKSRKKAEILTQENLSRIAEHINLTERASQVAEWEVRDRLVARHFAQFEGQTFTAIITSVQPFGCFVSVDKLAEGLLPRHQLADFAYIESQSAWRRTRGGKQTLRLGSAITVKLQESDPLSGRLTFGMTKDETQPNAPTPAQRPPSTRRPRRPF